MRQPKSTHEKRKLRLSPNKSYAVWGKSDTHIKGICIFTKFNLCLSYNLFFKLKIPLLLIRALDLFGIINIAYLKIKINALDKHYL